MNLKVNGELAQLSESVLTVGQLLELKNVESPDTVSVQVNGEFVDRAKYSTSQLREGDEVDFLYFLGGGAGL